MNERQDVIRERLLATFSPSECLVEDESALHAGHAGAASGGGHYRVRLISSVFEGKNRLIRHRLVYDCLADMMHKDIHALAIIAIAPSEIAN
ncbi:BolA family transcriptional regulator [Herbaspirillum sp. meg3]|uniref:BolA family protein n=1 Tax=Herbaspirillum sp. meg3 TaxID=2025949 RepID=UPI000B982125|nr:BolA family protein [Herbaspirillum sp. meg3]ASU41368.1 BolA family transcriptional regulator [Herbaspirillum sp. meg3]